MYWRSSLGHIPWWANACTIWSTHQCYLLYRACTCSFLKRIPSSSNLALGQLSGGPSMSNLLDAAMPPQNSSLHNEDTPQGENGPKSSNGLTSGMPPRVSSLDFLARLVCSNPIPASSGTSQPQPPGSSSAPAVGVKLEPLPEVHTSSGPLQEDPLRKMAPGETCSLAHHAYVPGFWSAYAGRFAAWNLFQSYYIFVLSFLRMAMWCKD